MFSLCSLARLGVAAAAFAIALPAMAGTLSSQLRSLADSYQQSPGLTVTRAAQATAARTPRPFSPHVSVAGKVQVYIHYRRSEMPDREALARLGASEVRISRALGVIQAWVPIANLERAATLTGVSRVSLPVYARIKGGNDVRPAASCAAVQDGLAIDHQGLEAENVTPLHAQGITGAGVKVGIISNGVDCRSASQAAGYLPANIFIPAELAGSGDEGTAMLEEIHAMAPDATLGFCGPTTNVEFLICLDEFAQWGADVISDDLGFSPVGYNFSVFTTDNGGNGIVEFAAAHPDISLTTSAGNDRQDYLEADYSADTTPHSPGIGAISLTPTYTVGGPLADFAAAGRSYNSAMDFGAALDQASDAAVAVKIFPGAGIFGDLTWNDPVAGPYDDLDLFLLNADGSVACAPASDGSQWCASTLDQITFAPQGLPPFEFLVYENDTNSPVTLYLVALCYDCSAHGTQPLHMKLYGFGNGGAQFNYTTDGGVSGHGALEVEIATAAAFFRGRGSSQMESFSDTGPFTFGDWVQGPQTRGKPDITGIDQVTVSGAGGFPTTFTGTSAASPNVAAVIALLRSGFPDAEPNAAAWKQVILDTASTDALLNYSLAASGAGLVDAQAAAASLAGDVTAAITAPATSPFQVDPATDVNFAATCDFEGDGTPSYLWTFGGNSGIPDSTKLTPDPVQYANAGVYTVVFTCTVGNRSDSDQVVIEVQAAPPPPPPPPSDDGGGGGFGGLALVLLGAAAILLRRRR